MVETPATCRLYLITPPRIDADFANSLTRALDAGDVACLQLRLKDAPEDLIRAAIDTLRPIAQSRDVAFLLNDNPKLAAETHCDGVHIGQEDAPYRNARDVMGPEAIIGVSCHASRHLAIEAAERGADYIAFGDFHAIDPEMKAEPEILEWWHDVTTVPAVAVGGITVENCPPIVRAGAEFIAVASGVWGYAKGVAAAIEDFNAAIASAKPN